MSRDTTLRGLEDAARRAVAAARRDGRRQWLAWRGERAAGDPLASIAHDADDAFFYEAAEDAFTLAATGAAASLRAEGVGRFDALESETRALSQVLHVAGDADAPPEAGPLLVGGFAWGDEEPRDEVWKDFPAARLVLPRVLRVRLGAQSHLCVVREVSPTDEPGAVAHAVASEVEASVASAPARPAIEPGELRLRPLSGGTAHRALVARALEAIGAGEIEKVVVARALDVERDEPFDAASLLHELRTLYPACAVFGLRRRGAWFAGATPERLLRRRGRRARATVLAGSAPRGRSPDEDARLRRALVESKKEQAEHAIVVRAIREALEPVCETLGVPEAPRVLSLGGVQHLWTPVEGLLRDDHGLLELAGRIHPTPAVAGSPREAALAWLDAHEGLERGWYAGLVGWTTLEGDGELSAALRCAVLRGGRARLFAGGGIVEGSCPEAERAETRLKWNALLPSLLEL